jgi:hypothetical protein
MVLQIHRSVAAPRVTWEKLPDDYALPFPNPPALARRFARAKGRERIGALFHNVEITLCLQQASPLIKGGRR